MVHPISLLATLFFFLFSLSSCNETGLKMGETSSDSEPADESTSAGEEGAPATEPLPTPTEDDATVPVETGETTGTAEEAGSAVTAEGTSAEVAAETTTTATEEGATTEGGGSDEVASETCADLPLTVAPKIPQPHLKRKGTNIVSDPTITSSSSWYLSGSSVYDPDVSRTEGSGSIKFPSGFDSGVRQYAYLGLGGLAVPNPGKTYVFSAYVKSSVWPPGLMQIAPSFRNLVGAWVSNGPNVSWGSTGANEWQEITVYYTTRSSDEAFIELFFDRLVGPRNDGDLWIDDVYIGEIDERIQFEQPPSKKTPFAGSQTKVDALGNVEVLRNGAWEPFFPLCMYPASPSYRDWSFYSVQGFNCLVGGANTADALEQAKNAVSAFNPGGMLGALDITFWTLGSTPLSDLSNRLDEIHSRGLDEWLFMYYWDNEFYTVADTDAGWARALTATDKVKEKDLDANGNRQRPIYALQGTYGVARMYHNTNVQMTDVIGTYVSGNVNEEYSDVGGLDILNNIEDQTNPVVFAQMNLLAIPTQFRPLLYWAIARGAKGMGFWRDLYTTTGSYLVNGENWLPLYGPIENQSWWTDFPNIRREIDQMMPLIRRPHWTSWKAVSSNSSIKLGTRDYKDEGYIIVANMSDSESAATITLSDLYYTPASVKNFFTGETAATLADSKFTITLSAYGTAVYRLEQAPQKPAGCEEGQ